MFGSVNFNFLGIWFSSSCEFLCLSEGGRGMDVGWASVFGLIESVWIGLVGFTGLCKYVSGMTKDKFSV